MCGGDRGRKQGGGRRALDRQSSDCPRLHVGGLLGAVGFPDLASRTLRPHSSGVWPEILHILNPLSGSTVQLRLGILPWRKRKGHMAGTQWRTPEGR